MDRNSNNHLPEGMDPGLFMYKYKYIDGESLYFHAHRGIEILYIYSGCGEIMVENQTYPIEDHTLVLFQPYQLHRVMVPPAEGRSYIRTNLTFDPGFMDHYLSAFPILGQFFRNLWRGSLRQPVFYGMNDTRIPEVLKELHQCTEHAAAGQEENTGILILQLIRLFQTRLPGVLSEDNLLHSRGSSHVQRITEWLDEHYKEPFSLEALAASLHLSPYHISHVFKQYAGITPSEYLMQRRVREACILLANTSQSIGEIAVEVGNLSPSYFSQMFKKNKGISPRNTGTASIESITR